MNKHEKHHSNPKAAMLFLRPGHDIAVTHTLFREQTMPTDGLFYGSSRAFGFTDGFIPPQK